ncbi:MAG: hypothetical protein CSA95_02505 [Bacteroidetes bacterium]|nr:MAG: hypothetical protein CSA95_02505 [Bacteroidota bacterium]
MRTLKQLIKTILKYRLSSGLTLLSLVVAFLGIVVLSLYVSYEHSYDRFHENGKHIYRICFGYEQGSWLPAPMKALVEDNIPEVEKAVVFSGWWDNQLYAQGKTKKDAVSAQMMAVSEDFFSMFSFPLISGQADKVLTQPNTLVVSETLAEKLFGTIDVVGKPLMVRGDEPYIISGVMKEMPNNSTFKRDAFVSFASLTQPGDDWRAAQTWEEWSFNIFFQLKKGADVNAIVDKISALEKMSKELQQIEESYSKEVAFLKLQPLSELHFDTKNSYFPSTNKSVLNILTLLVVVLLVMGAVNFVNFSTSQAPLRAKSLSVQQILGERKGNARWQIVGEAILLSLFALGIALLIHHFTYQKVEDLFRIEGLSISTRPLFYGLFVAFAVLFGMVAGVYPARYITSAPVSQAVKGKMFFSGKGKRFRNVLVTTQFVFTIALIASALTIEKQLEFWNNFDIGIDKENVLYLYTTPALRESYQAFADELMKNPEITDYTYSQSLVGGVGMGWGREVDGQQIQIKAWPVDERFLDFFGITMVDGRKFYKGESDINNFILNEKAVQKFGWEKPLEKRFPGFGFEGDIVGISKNFNFSSLKGEIQPLLFWLTNTRKYVVMLKANTTNYTRLKAFIAETAQKFDPENTFEARFLDDRLEQLYSKETRMAHFIEFVALWTILLALTGLLGLIIFMSRDRVKEIGVRKVNGATIIEIVKMLNKSVFTWLAIAFVIATPVAYYAMRKWLENFAYKTELSWWIFALAGFSALTVALLTVSWQSWKAASRNPVEALRYE